MILYLNSMRNQSRQKTKSASGRQRGVRSDFPVSRKAVQMVGIFQPCSGSSGNLATGAAGAQFPLLLGSLSDLEHWACTGPALVPTLQTASSSTRTSALGTGGVFGDLRTPLVRGGTSPLLRGTAGDRGTVTTSAASSLCDFERTSLGPSF